MAPSDAMPDRLDLPDEYVRKAVEAGVKIAIDSDAHQPPSSLMPTPSAWPWRGWARGADVVNTRSVTECLAQLKTRRPGRRR